MLYGHVPGITKPVSRLVQGTATFNADDEAAVFLSLDTAMELGYNTFDTAENYGPAKEIVFGKWLRTRGVRDRVVILAKGAHPYDGVQRVTPADIDKDMRGTMQRMQVDYLDLYVLHRDDPAVPVGPIVEALNAHQKAGRIGAFGGSNWTHTRIAAANAYARSHGLTPFAVSSPNFSLAEQYHEPWVNCVSISGSQGEAARQWYAADGIALFGWSSLAGGLFSGRFSRSNLGSFSKDDYWAQICIHSYCGESNFQRLDRVQALAQAKGLATAQIALAYVMDQPQNIFALVTCANREQYAANAAALAVRLTPREQAYLDLRADTPG